MRTIRQGVLLAAVVGAVQCGGAERTSVTPSTPRSLDFAPEPSDGRKEPRLALVIGNAAYAEGPLANPVNDARLMEQTLKGLDFEVIRHDNANQRTMREALVEFSDRIKGGVALFYYAGHGVEVDRANYMVPVGVNIRRREDVKIQAVPVDDVLQSVRGRPSRLNVVILDACRNDPFTRSFRGGSAGGLGTMDAPDGTLIAYATAPGTVAADGSGENGTYTRALSRFMQQEGLGIEDVFKYVRAEVVRETSSQQRPWESSSMMPGAFYFKGKPAAVAECPQGSALQGGKCVASVVCPTGTRFLEGTGCVANVVQPAQPAQPPPVPQPSPVPVPPPPRPPVPAVVPTPVVSDPGASFRAANLVWQKEPAPNEMNWE
ncbi:MAG: caspase family protein, partial [Myxococcales bacterium]